MEALPVEPGGLGWLSSLARSIRDAIGSSGLWQVGDQETTSLEQTVRQEPGDADAHYRLGRRYRDQNRLTDALRELNEAAALSSNDARVHVAKGEVYAALGSLDAALIEYDLAVDIAPEDPIAYFWRGQLYQLQGGYEEAIDQYSQVINLSPKLPLGYVARAEVVLSMGRIMDAQHDLDTARKLAPDDPAVLMASGELLQKKGDLLGALRDFRRAANQRPDDASIQVQQAAVLVDLEAYDRAVVAYDRAIHIRPSDPDIWADRAYGLLLWARDLELANRFAEARRSAERAVQLAPNHDSAYIVIGSAAAALGDCTRAQQAFAAASQLKMHYGWGSWEEAKGLYRCKMLEAALSAARRLSECGPGWAPHANVGLGMITRQLGTNDESAEALKSALGSPVSAESYVTRATLLYEWDAWTDVIADCESAIELDAQSAVAYNIMAWIRAEKLHADLDRCIGDAQKGLELARDAETRAMCLDTLGWVWHLKGDRTTALEYLTQAVELAEPDLLKRTHLAAVTSQSVAEKDMSN